jgi:aminopeptidase N
MPTGTAAADGPDFTPGSPSAGDPYYPRLGNGGYDVRHYDLRLDYQPSSDRLAGVATLSARATQHLSRFNLDFVGMTVHDVRVDGRRAAWSRTGPELSITPQEGLRRGRHFTVRVSYDGVPRPLPFPDVPELKYGWIHTDDGSWVASQPDAASTWFPGNDHPSDLATYDFTITVPESTEAVANGRLTGVRRHGGKATWHWRLRSSMATYLATVTVGEFDLHAHRTPGGIPVLDAIDPDVGDVADDELAKQARILAFEERLFGPYRSRRPARSSTTTGPASRSRPRPVRSTSARCSIPMSTARTSAKSSWCTNWPISGWATASYCDAGGTSG